MSIDVIECIVNRKDLTMKQQAEICRQQSEIADNDRLFIKPMADFIAYIM
mgnify:FL=1